MGPLPSGVRERTRWRCPNGHVLRKSFFDVRRKRGNPCDDCSGMGPKTARDYHARAKRKRVRWLGPLPARTTDITNWRCEAGHTFSTSYHTLRKSRGNGCPHCSKKAKKTDQDYQRLAAEKNLTWRGPNPGNVHKATSWMCHRGHAFTKSYHEIEKSPGNGCATCSGMAPKTRADYRRLGRPRGIRWVGKDLPKDSKTPTDWECLYCGHVWRAAFGNICHQETGCPQCVDTVNGRRVSKQQRALAEMLDGQLNVECGGYIVDVLIRKRGVPIVLEYDSWFYHAGRLEADEERDEALVSAGCKVLPVKSNTLVPTPEQLADAIDELLGGKDRVALQLPDWGEGPSIPLRKTRDCPACKRAWPEGCVAIDASPSQCIAELDGRRLFIRRGKVDLHKIPLAPAEAKVLHYGLQQSGGMGRRNVARVLYFTAEGLRDALGHVARNDGATRTLMGRLRKRVRFMEGEPVGLILGMTKRRYATAVRVRWRPPSRRSRTIQTLYNEWRSFRDARAFARGLGLTNLIEWCQWSKTSARPADIPSNPQRAYRDCGWKNWGDWLGTRDATEGWYRWQRGRSGVRL